VLFDSDFQESAIRLLSNVYWSGDAGKPFVVDWQGVRFNSLRTFRVAEGQEQLAGTPTGYGGDPKLNKVGSAAPVDDIQKISQYRLTSDSILICAGLNMKALNNSDMGRQDFFGVQLFSSGGAYNIGASALKPGFYYTDKAGYYINSFGHSRVFRSFEDWIKAGGPQDLNRAFVMNKETPPVIFDGDCP
jgi:hypothetical protein